MIRRQFLGFVLRWLGSSFGMYLCISLFGRFDDKVNIYTNTLMMYAVAGLIFSVISTVIKPLVKLMTLPLALVTMGLSTLVINAAMFALAIYILPGVNMGFWGIVASSAVLSSINVLLSLFI